MCGLRHGHNYTFALAKRQMAILGIDLSQTMLAKARVRQARSFALVHAGATLNLSGTRPWRGWIDR